MNRKLKRSSLEGQVARRISSEEAKEKISVSLISDPRIRPVTACIRNGGGNQCVGHGVGAESLPPARNVVTRALTDASCRYSRHGRAAIVLCVT